MVVIDYDILVMISLVCMWWLWRWHRNRWQGEGAKRGRGHVPSLCLGDYGMAYTLSWQGGREGGMGHRGRVGATRDGGSEDVEGSRLEILTLVVVEQRERKSVCSSVCVWLVCRWQVRPLLLVTLQAGGGWVCVPHPQGPHSPVIKLSLLTHSKVVWTDHCPVSFHQKSIIY